MTSSEIPNVQTLTMSELEATSSSAGAPAVLGASLPNPLHQVRTRISVCVGGAEITIGDLMGLREQQVLTLDRTVEQPVDILLEGKVIARGILVAVEDTFGVRVTELPVPLNP